MNTEKLNITAVQAAQGCLESERALILYFIPIIQRMSKEVWHLLRDESAFEQACYRKVLNAARKYNPAAGRSFRNFVLHKLRGVRSKYLAVPKYRIKLNYLSIEALASKDDEGNETTYEVPDNLAVIDDALIINEKIALLAEDDSRKLAILNAWSNGEYNDSETASFLAKRYGGNSESHRKFINRFRTTCQKALA
ncbi:hypothetical protein EV294_112117 [Paenibacillus sp. BK033]|uniref:hypothetical protein n=1 Tax=Paenibacillus sp. BK033 TaxID=2512133 RepID=UPI0010441E1C|nr:hypothetical protein [Paenibacillus sp. BK033]TCM89652.1 hypothetical protein EV294_112117 [Paenibacillus sp. BK033]